MNAHAAIFDQAGKAFRIAELPLPASLKAGELVVEIALATICGSDLHTHSGRRMEPTPCVLGHEGVGRVIAAGAGRERWMGRRVTWSSVDCCGQCTACTQWDLPQKCERVFKYGHATLHEASGATGGGAGPGLAALGVQPPLLRADEFGGSALEADAARVGGNGHS
jgi:D-arabinose 1-dehydrogenase-like Zn-dependent alcohol dehydrogenase